MKTRNGFVSNSSASSFCIFGCTIENITYSEDHTDDNNDDESRYEELYNSTDKPKEVDIECLSYDSTIYVGISPWQCRDDETMGEFKTRTKETVTAFLKQHKIDTTDLKFTEIEECEGQ